MQYTLDPQLIAVALVALLLGLMIGFTIRSPLKRRVAVLNERNDGLARERDGANAERDRLIVELKAREAQIRPLSDEIDKLRRDFARAQRGEAAIAAPAVDMGNVALLKGVGVKFGERLAAAGITRIDQIAGWSGGDISVIDAQMGDFRGRIAGDRLVEQAILLREGRVTEYETLFGKLG
jgi:predicted flap endonuclease-1-like 5' DNA nuclease